MAETIETKFLLTAQNRASAIIGTVRGDLDRASQSVTAFRGALAALGAGAAAAVFAAQAKGAIDLADELGKLSQRTGITVESLSALRYQAGLSGVEFGELQTALRFYNSRITDAAGGNKEALESFQRMGFSQKDLQGALSDSEGFLKRIADKFETYSEGAARSALAADVFGSRNEKMVLTLAQGSKGMEQARQELERFGGVMSGDFAKKAEEFNDNLDRLSTLSQVAGRSLAERLVPKVNELLKEMLKGIEIAGGFGRALALFGTINPFRDVAGNIIAVREEIDRLQAAQSRALAQGRDGAAAGFTPAIDAERKRLEFLQFQQRQAIKIGEESTFDARDLARQQRERAALTQPPLKTTSAAGGADPGQAFLETLRKRLVAIEQDEYAVLRLEAAQNKVAGSAEPLIRQLQTETEFRKELAAVRQRDEASAQAVVDRNVAALLGVDEYVKGLQAETAAIRLSSEERLISAQVLKLEANERLRGTEEIEKARTAIARAVNDNAAAKIFEETRTPVERFREEFDRLGALLQSGALDWDTYGRAVDEARERLQSTQKAAGDTKSTAQELGLTFASAAEDALVKWEGVGTFFKALEQDLLRIGTRKLFTEPLTKGLGNIFEGKNTAVNGVLDSFLKFVGARAMGGAVGAGMPYLVGESGPELFVPRSGGSVIPNNRLSAGGGSVVIHQHFAPGTSRETVTQAALQTGRTVQAAMRRNG